MVVIGGIGTLEGPFVGMLIIYLRHNLAALKLLGLPLDRIRQALPIDATFFERGLQLQAFLSFLLAIAIAPALMSPDLRNNGLALYLSRPFTRGEYILGKLFVLVAVLSSIIVLPGILLYVLQGYLEGGQDKRQRSARLIASQLPSCRVRRS